MPQPLLIGAILAIFLTHVPVAVRMIRVVRRRQLLSPVEFAILSIFLYYHFGLGYLVFCLLAERETQDTSLLLRGWESTTAALLFIWAAPFALEAGSRLVARYTPSRALPSVQATRAQMTAFYLLSLTISAGIAYQSFGVYSTSQSIWMARLQIAQTMGVFVFLLYFPLHCLVFHCLLRARARWLALSLSLVIGALTVIAVLPIGQRTLVLLPVLVVALFHLRPSITRTLTVGGACLLVAALVLPLFKWQYANVRLDVAKLVDSVVTRDISRNEVLADSIEYSPLLGTNLMPHPGAGYTYSLLFFVPRSLLPEKGRSTAQHFTGFVTGSAAEDMTWGLGLGAIEELILNFGIVAALPGLLCWGALLSFLDSYSARTTSLYIPLRLTGLWLCATHLPALILMFGFMVAFNLAFHFFFSAGRERVPAAPALVLRGVVQGRRHA
jgi:hypothetical protein